MDQTDLVLMPMSEADFREFRDRVIREYAKESVAAGRVESESAIEWSRKETDKLLPDGLGTKDVLLFKITLERRQEVALGTIWCGKDPGNPSVAFIYDLFLHPEHRGQGYGTVAMKKLESLLRDNGFTAVGLHVYTHNRSAVKLYKKLGFTATSMNLSKEL